MRVLFDQGTPEPLRKSLTAHHVSTAMEMGWSQLTNGELLDAAEKAFDVFVTTDQTSVTSRTSPLAHWPFLS